LMVGGLGIASKFLFPSDIHSPPRI